MTCARARDGQRAGPKGVVSVSTSLVQVQPHLPWLERDVGDEGCPLSRDRLDADRLDKRGARVLQGAATKPGGYIAQHGSTVCLHACLYHCQAIGLFGGSCTVQKRCRGASSIMPA
jgi:hypothetical protein